VPFQLATVEFYARARSRLAPKGVFALNLATPPSATELLGAFAATLRAAFPHVARFEVANEGGAFSNFVFVASEAPLTPPRDADLPAPLVGEVARTIRASWTERLAPEGAWVLTDDRAPVELLTDKVLLGRISR
jgi:spermidine synthase